MAARQAQIDDLNRKHGLRPGHNRAKARTQREAFDKNHVPHRSIDFQSEYGRALCERLHLASRDLPALITASGMPRRRPSPREVARIAGLLPPLARREANRSFRPQPQGLLWPVTPYAARFWRLASHH